MKQFFENGRGDQGILNPAPPRYHTQNGRQYYWAHAQLLVEAGEGRTPPETILRWLDNICDNHVLSDMAVFEAMPS